jgi:DNA-binding transcriptional ArsR family regulator
VFVYALQSFRQRDKVKAWVYLVLSLLLAITGGAMLMFQLIANTTGLQENSLPSALFYSLAGLRVLVSVSYVYLCRAKHIRFTDLSEDGAPETSTAISEETMQQVLANLAEFERWKQQLASGDVPLLSSPDTDETTSDTDGLQAQLERLLSTAPDITVRDAAAIVGKPTSTVGRHLAKLRQTA